MADNRKYLDFEIVKENWNKYHLSDGSNLKTRIILKSAWLNEKDSKKNYGFDIQIHTVIMCDPSLQGAKNQTKFTNEQLQKNIEIDACRYDTVAYEVNEYVLDDTTRILVHPNLTKISRTKLHDINGDRIYHVDIHASVSITIPKQ